LYQLVIIGFGVKKLGAKIVKYIIKKDKRLTTPDERKKNMIYDIVLIIDDGGNKICNNSTGGCVKEFLKFIVY